MNEQLHFSTGNDEHDTPESFFRPIANAVGGFDLDPCASEESELAGVNYTAQDDGKSKEWFGKVWLNPPYSEIEDWVCRCEREMLSSLTPPEIIVGLFPARTSTQWFHNHVTSADLHCYIEGRLRFSGAKETAPFPSMVVVWGDTPDALVKHLNNIGHVNNDP